MFQAKGRYFKLPRSRLGFCEETQNYAKRKSSQIFFFLLFFLFVAVSFRGQNLLKARPDWSPPPPPGNSSSTDELGTDLGSSKVSGDPAKGHGREVPWQPLSRNQTCKHPSTSTFTLRELWWRNFNLIQPREVGAKLAK